MKEQGEHGFHAKPIGGNLSFEACARHIVKTVVTALLPLGKSVEENKVVEIAIDLVCRILSPRTERRADRVTPSNPEGYVSIGIDIPKARLKVRQALDAIGYCPDEAECETMTDLGSDDRINLLLDMSVKMAQGYGNWRQGQVDSILDVYPAQELFRAEERDLPRDWLTRWQVAGGRLYNGRMIAVKNDNIWTEISAFGQFYPPFDFNSGMDVRDVARDEALDLGVIDSDTAIEPVQFPVFADSIDQLGAKVSARLRELIDAQQKRRTDPLTYGTIDELLDLAQERMEETDGLAPEDLDDVRKLAGKALEMALGCEAPRASWGVYNKLAHIYAALKEPEKADSCRQKALELEVALVTSSGSCYDRLKTAENLLANTSEIKFETKNEIVRLVELALEEAADKNRFRAKAHKILARLYERSHEPELAEANRQKYVEFADGFELLRDAKQELATRGKNVDLETGARISEMLYKAVERIPENRPEDHAEAYRATAEILEAAGDNEHAVAYYEYALLKNPKIGVKRRLATLKKTKNG